MAQYNLRFLAALGLALTLSMPSLASSGGSMRVRIFVESACKFINSNAINMDFGDLAHGNRSINASTQINCVNGTPFKLQLNEGLYAINSQRRMKHATQAAWLPYGLSVSPATGTGNGQNINVALTATVKEIDYQSKPIGHYNDVVILTINP
ncbi:spore coat protein U domain-containing protein [Deefgea salmonis]|uniref:Spore coat U domain-containing protein n=1 Tax=Deefgea salmonis TaxID=2875502 RepID=A0ABS8BMA4_9NEIS|nr:spore coat protein U domain-containing protein [Deefgea salmonis]MCB5196855.1 spore coat U domain-containing protein [Deefgea salmonis]